MFRESLEHIGHALREPEGFTWRWQHIGSPYPWWVFAALAATAIVGTTSYGMTMGLLGGVHRMLECGLACTVAAGIAYHQSGTQSSVEGGQASLVSDDIDQGSDGSQTLLRLAGQAETRSRQIQGIGKGGGNDAGTRPRRQSLPRLDGLSPSRDHLHRQILGKIREALATMGTLRSSSYEANCMEEYGTIRIMLVPLPLKRPRTPSLCQILLKVPLSVSKAGAWLPPLRLVIVPFCTYCAARQPAEKFTSCAMSSRGLAKFVLVPGTGSLPSPAATRPCARWRPQCRPR